MAGTYTPIATSTLNAASNTIEFSSISGSYTDLIIVGSLRMDNVSSGAQNTLFRFNDDTGNNYSSTYMLGDGSSPSSSATGSMSSLLVSSVGSDSANRYSSEIWHINNYSNSTTFKTVLTRHNVPFGNQVQTWIGLWRSTSPITKISIIGGGGSNFAANSKVTLYGILAA